MNLLVALGIGLLLGAERERHKGAAVPILVALTANSVTKAVLATTLGGRRFGARVTVGLVLVLAAAWTGWAVS